MLRMMFKPTLFTRQLNLLPENSGNAVTAQDETAASEALSSQPD